MAIDITRQGTKGGDPQYDTSNLRGVREERGVVTGIVKANVHGSHMGVIKVWIPNFSTDETDKSQWRTVRYCTLIIAEQITMVLLTLILAPKYLVVL